MPPVARRRTTRYLPSLLPGRERIHPDEPEPRVAPPPTSTVPRRDYTALPAAPRRLPADRGGPISYLLACLLAFFSGADHHLAELDLGPLGLQGDLAAAGGGLVTFVHQVAVDPDLDGGAARFDDHRVPLAQRLLRAVGQVEDAAGVGLGAAPLLAVLARAALLHVGHGDVLLDDPEVAGVPALHLHLDGLREHLVQRARRGGVHQHPAVAGLAGEAVLHLQPVVLVGGLGDEVALGVAQADQLAVAHDEAVGRLRVGVLGGHVGLPAGEILAVEQRGHLARRRRLGRRRPRQRPQATQDQEPRRWRMAWPAEHTPGPPGAGRARLPGRPASGGLGLKCPESMPETASGGASAIASASAGRGSAGGVCWRRSPAAAAWSWREDVPRAGAGLGDPVQRRAPARAQPARRDQAFVSVVMPGGELRETAANRGSAPAAAAAHSPVPAARGCRRPRSSSTCRARTSPSARRPRPMRSALRIKTAGADLEPGLRLAHLHPEEGRLEPEVFRTWQSEAAAQARAAADQPRPRLEQATRAAVLAEDPRVQPPEADTTRATDRRRRCETWLDAHAARGTAGGHPGRRTCPGTT